MNLPGKLFRNSNLLFKFRNFKKVLFLTTTPTVGSETHHTHVQNNSAVTNVQTHRDREPEKIELRITFCEEMRIFL